MPRPLAEVTLNASSDELRDLADFLRDCAAEMDDQPERQAHWHLADRFKRFQDAPHFVVFHVPDCKPG
ncbi:Imm32 family immunity protein [Eleftheria terrae]|uniref:Imm32 family immunity protein n=1 Tax=Eleftheria terrae TaxID=1597781 RepID=UPI00263A53F3|nr:hypothetical protein [Eleftheria terrae]WKB55394.1 hypothetical protein N7L95_25260 [Eleftheria terrae]